MLDSIKAIKSMSFHLKALERVGDKIFTAESDIKINSNPKMIYFHSVRKKISVFWKDGANNGNALVKARMTFNATVSLDPYGNLMRKNQHYTIHELGYVFFAKTLSIAILKGKETIEKKFTYLGKKNLKEKPCFVIMYDDAEFGYFEYKTNKNESVSSIAIKFNVSDFAIRSKNDLHSFYGTIKEGTILKIPNNYCKKIIIFIDEKNMLPMNITTYDEVGLYENYEYENLELNNKLTFADFQQFYND